METASSKTEEFHEAVVSEPLLRAYMPELDTIRGIAILAVVLYHAFYWSNDLSLYSKWQRAFLASMSVGQFGVNLFFVLSGFLITGILIDSKGRQHYYSRFYFRRALRILPAYYFTIFLLIVFGLTSRGFLLMSLAYCANLSGLFGIALSYGVLWSLAVEEHFYLLWPTAIKKLQSGQLIWLVSAILIACPALRYAYFLRGIHDGPASNYGYFTWNAADGLALGALIAVLARKPRWARRQTLQLAITLLFLAICIAAIGYPSILTRRTAVGQSLQEVPWNLACGAVLCLFLLLGTSRWKGTVAPPLLTFFGRISYGLYLYHVLFLTGYTYVFQRFHLDTRIHVDLFAEVWERAIIAGGAAVLFSYLSRRYFEEPFLRLKEVLPELLARRKSNQTAD